MRTQHSKGQYTLSRVQAENIINTARNYRDRCVLKCLYWGGMRVSEVCNLRVEHISFDTHVIHIYKSKYDKTRTIPFIDTHYESDMKHLIGKKLEGQIFPVTTRRVQQIVRRAGKESGVVHPDPTSRGVNPHLFRHSIARYCKDTYGMEFTQLFLGHKSLKTTMDVYGTLSVLDMQRLIASRTGQHSLLPNPVVKPEVLL